MKNNISVIILTYNEKLHIRRCIENVKQLNPKQIFVVDCFSTDGTQEIAKELGATVVEHEWPGFYAKQFNWALDNLPIKSTWVLRLDADEYLTPETIERLNAELPNISADVDGLTLELKHRFMGREIRHATVGLRLLRLFRYGRGRLEDRAMDEHVIVGTFEQHLETQLWELKTPGASMDFNGAFYDDNLNTFEWWKQKHIDYAKREAMDALELFSSQERMKNPSKTDLKKMKYYRLPPYFRALLYFGLRYFVKGGFLDGRAGWQWNFWQALWYRWTVDRNIARMKRERRAVTSSKF